MTSHRAFDVANEGLPITLSSDFGRQQTLCRKPQLDPAFKSLFPPPNHPSYPAAHGCLSTAAATTLARLFPRDAEALLALGKQAAEARIFAGIHYRSDINAGQALGRAVAEQVMARTLGSVE